MTDHTSFANELAKFLREIYPNPWDLNNAVQTLTELAEAQYDMADASYEQGYSDGKEEGRNEGYDDGYDEGHEKGSEEGYSEGYKEAIAAAHNAITYLRD